MKRFCTMVLTVSCMALALVLAGGTPSAQAAPPANPFSLNWSGGYQVFFDGNLVQVGLVEWKISAQGVLAGTHDHPADPDFIGVLLGHVKPDGKTHITNAVGGGIPAIASPGESWINADGQMEGEYTQAGQGAIVIVVVMDPV